MNIQYLGFEQDQKSRTYSFRVIETPKPDREFQLCVDLQLLTATKFKFQDIPDLCFAKLKSDLASELPEQTIPLWMQVSAVELQQYVAKHYDLKHKRA